uniref:C2H2-type domain-containing protein n=1 Tax=Taenia asiatica TaxID=60517 RepID=A0A158RA85_TAEAS
LTHASKKPHGCQFCDKSYSDARSLRRHYENAHPDEYESWCFLSRVAEEGEVSIAEAIAKMTQLSADVATSSASASVPSTGSNGTSLAQQIVGAKGVETSSLHGTCMHRRTARARALKTVPTAVEARHNFVCVCVCGEARPTAATVLGVTLASRSLSSQSGGATRCACASVLVCVEIYFSRYYYYNYYYCLTSVKVVTNGRNSPWLSAVTGSAAGGGGGNGGGASGRTSPAIPEHLKAILMAPPLEEPRVVACSLCKRRFKNQSALNGHMRLHGGYSLNHAPGTTAPAKPQPPHPQPQPQSQQPPLAAPVAAVKLKKEQQQQQAQQLPLGVSGRSLNDSLLLLRDLPETKSEGPTSLFDWPPTTATTTTVVTAVAPCVSAAAAATAVAVATPSRSMRPWPPHASPANQQQPTQSLSQPLSGVYDAARADLPRTHSELHFNESGAVPSTTVYRGTGFRKRPSSTTFSGPSSPHQFRAGTAAHEHAWMPHQPTQLPPPPPPPSLQSLRGRNEMDPIFNNLRLLDSAPAALREQSGFERIIARDGDVYISRMAPHQFQHHNSSNSSGGGDYPGSSLTMFGEDQSVFFPGASASSSSSYHQRGDSGTSTSGAPQPHYSPITPASGGLVMRHPMTPQHNAHGGQPRAYSYSATSTQAAYSVPLMPSHERVFFPDELDPLLASQEETKDVRRPITPIPEIIPLPPSQSLHPTPKQCFELSCVPTHKSASDEGSVFRNPQPPPLLHPHPPSPSLLLPQPPPLSASSSASALKKVKRKPAPIFTHRINPSRLRSPRLWPTNGLGDGFGGGDPSTAPMGAAALGALLEPPPYTPPPMLSPNRRGSGLFSSIARFRRPPRTATSHLRVATAAGAVSTFTGAATATTVHKTSVFATHVALHVSSPGPPKSAPAFVKNLADFSSRTLSSSAVADDGAPPTVAMRATTPELTEAEGCRVSKPLFFGDEDDEFTSMLSAAEGGGGGGMASGMKDTPDTDEANTHSPHRNGTTATIAATVTNATTNVSHCSSSSSCCCCSEVSPVRHRMGEDEEDEDESEDDIVEDIGVPSNFEPKINVGTAYQAEVPDFVGVVDTYHDDTRVYDVLVWNPKNIDENDPKMEESLSNLMNLARSPVVRNCGLNMEYTFHLLCKFQGDFEMTLRALLRESFTIFDRVYSETEYWTTEEIEKFQTSLRRHDKDFHHVAAELQAYGMKKSVKACVEFYYVWKRMNTPHEVNRYRGRVHRKNVPPRGERPPPEEVTHPPTNEICGLTGVESLPNRPPYDLEVPPALGVEGDVASSASYNLRSKHTDLPPPIDHEFEERGIVTVHEPEPTTTTSAAVATMAEVAREGSVEGFPCRQCGRCFAKVKSRNAHMKSHVASAHSKQDQ